VNPALPQDTGQSVIIYVIKPCLDIQEQGGDLEVWPLQSFDVIGEGEARIVGAKPRE